MKNLLFTLTMTFVGSIFLTVQTSCNKDKDDPRDAYIGTYAISATYICSDIYNNYYTDSYTGTIVVKKGGGENELLFTDSFQTDHLVTLHGSSFTIEAFTTTTIGGTGSGGGSFGNDGSISYNLGTLYGATGATCSEEGSGTRL